MFCSHVLLPLSNTGINFKYTVTFYPFILAHSGSVLILALVLFDMSCTYFCTNLIKRNKKLHEQYTLLYLLFWAYPLCVVLLRLLFQQRGAFCHIWFYIFLFSSVVCVVLCKSLRQHDSAISTTLGAFPYGVYPSLGVTCDVFQKNLRIRLGVHMGLRMALHMGLGMDSVTSESSILP